MAAVDQGFAAALKGEHLTATVSAEAGAWAGRGRQLAVTSPLATREGAAAEGSRLLALFGGPLVRDRAVVDGERRNLARRCIRLRGGLDYSAAGDLVFVLGVQEQANGTTILTVLRRLA